MTFVRRHDEEKHKDSDDMLKYFHYWALRERASASFTCCSTVSSSARAWGETPILAKSSSFSEVLKMPRSILRRWPKAAAVARSNSSNEIGSADFLGTRRMMAESTLGGGTKAP